MTYDKILYLAGANAGAIFTYFYGGWDSNEGLKLLGMLVLADFLTGIYASFVEGKKNPADPTKGINSDKGSWGIFKKGLMFMVIMLLHRLDILLGTGDSLSLMTGAIYFYLFNEGVSLMENLGRAGVPIPDQLKLGITTLKNKAELPPDVVHTVEEVKNVQQEIEQKIQEVKDSTSESKDTNTAG